MSDEQRINTALDHLEDWNDRLSRPDCAEQLEKVLQEMSAFIVRMTGTAPATGRYLIWSNEHRAWWRPYRDGYTRRLLDAGWYDHGTAIAICVQAIASSKELPNEVPVALADMVAIRDAYRAMFPDSDEEWL